MPGFYAATISSDKDNRITSVYVYIWLCCDTKELREKKGHITVSEREREREREGERLAHYSISKYWVLWYCIAYHHYIHNRNVTAAIVSEEMTLNCIKVSLVVQWDSIVLTALLYWLSCPLHSVKFLFTINTSVLNCFTEPLRGTQGKTWIWFSSESSLSHASKPLSILSALEFCVYPRTPDISGEKAKKREMKNSLSINFLHVESHNNPSRSRGLGLATLDL